MSIDLESLGITKEELQTRVIEQMCNKLLMGIATDEDGEYKVSSSFNNQLQKLIVDHVNAAVSGYAEKFVLPNVSSYIENLTLQETNKWGEKTGRKMTFTEYLVERAEAYIKEDVNYEGKTKAEAGGYSWSKAQTRIAHMIDKHLHYSIESAMEAALKTANSHIVEGLEKTVKIKLAEIAEKLKVVIKR